MKKGIAVLLFLLLGGLLSACRKPEAQLLHKTYTGVITGSGLGFVTIDCETTAGPETFRIDEKTLELSFPLTVGERITVESEFLSDEEKPYPAVLITPAAGEPAPEENAALKEKVPEYFGLPTEKGLEVYVWQMARDTYSFGLLPGTDREKTLEELWSLKGISAEDMKTVLSSYHIGDEDIFVIPFQNPVSSYLSEYWLAPEEEDPETAAKVRQAYLERIREMLF